MITKGVEKALNKQVSEEAYASHYYLAMGSWCDTNGLSGCATFLYQHAEQERAHMIKLFKYINDAGGHALSPEITKPPHQFKSLQEMFAEILRREIAISEKINDLVDFCQKERDYSTLNFLQWYVAEQHEEERLFKSILNKIKIIGTTGNSIFLIDREVGSLAKAG